MQSKIILFIVTTFLWNAASIASPTANEFIPCQKLAVSTLKHCLTNKDIECWSKSKNSFDACKINVLQKHNINPDKIAAAETYNQTKKNNLYAMNTLDNSDYSPEGFQLTTDKKIVIRSGLPDQYIEVFVSVDINGNGNVKIKQNEQLRSEFSGVQLDVTDICMVASSELRIDIFGYEEGIGTPFAYTIQIIDEVNWHEFALPEFFETDQQDVAPNHAKTSLISEQKITKNTFKAVPTCTSDYSDFIPR